MPVRLRKIFNNKLVLLIAALLFFDGVYAQLQDEINFKVDKGSEAKDPNPNDSIFFSMEEALKHPSRVKELSLEGKKLKHFPAGILTLKNLQTLNISYNRIDSLPAHLFEKCRKLEVLQYAGNELKKIPSVVFHPSLKVLDVSENNLTAIPEAVRQCIRLEELDLHANQLSAYPSSSFLLPSLKSLILSGNPLTTLGNWVLQQPALKILFMDNMPIERLPEGICSMNALRFLNLEENNLSELPACFCEMKKMKVLMVSGSALPEMRLKELSTCLPGLQIR